MKVGDRMAPIPGASIPVPSRQELDQQREALTRDMGSMAPDDPGRQELLVRLGSVQDALALWDVGERPPHH